MAELEPIQPRPWASFLKSSDLRYAAAVQDQIDKDPLKLSRWLTRTCPECGQERHDDWDRHDRTDPDHYDEHHIVYKGHIVIGCEGYWVIEPRSVGIDSEYWNDWTEEED